MKLSAVLTLMSLIMVTSMAQAEGFVNCASTQGTNRSFLLYVFNQNVLQVRIRVNSHRFRALTPIASQNQNIEGYTTYTIQGMQGELNAQNSILSGNGGLVRWANDEFSCQ